jgi:protein-S-isoprenylcysteine O-methyltransferase Ste14
MRPAQTAAQPLMALYEHTRQPFVEVKMRNIGSVGIQSARAREQQEAAMSGRERVQLAAIVGVFAVLIGVVGLFADRSRGILGTIGLVLIGFALVGAVQAAAIVMGFVTPYAARDEVKRAESHD